MPLIWGFLESDQKDHSRLPNDNLVAVKFDDDAVFDAVTHRKNAPRERALATVWASLRLLTRLREKGNKGRELGILQLNSTGRKKNT